MATRHPGTVAGLAYVGLALLLAAPVTAPPAAADSFETSVWNQSAQRAECGPGSNPESGLQGEVSQGDRLSGRSQQGYWCNLSLAGQYVGNGTSWVNPSSEHCAYLSAAWPNNLFGPNPGVHVVDVTDPRNPRLSARLTEPAMVGATWESLKVNEERGLLAGVAVGPGQGAGYFSIYDINADCAHPTLLNTGQGSQLTMPIPVVGHEGGFSPDGRTYWASGAVPGWLSAIDVSNPRNPTIIWAGATGLEEHGFSLSADGNRLYMSNLAGVTILDSSSIQRRDPHPGLTQVSTINWLDGIATQHTIPISIAGRAHLVVVDEGGSGGVKFLDISDERNPSIVGHVKLEVNLPVNAGRSFESTATNGIFGYESHYCSVNRPVDPTLMACGWFQSGVRVFDISNINAPAEVAYYNPPGQLARRAELTNSEHASGVLSLIGPALPGIGYLARSIAEGQSAPIPVPPGIGLTKPDLTADFCGSPPEFHGNQLWVTCQDSGFMALEFANGVGPNSASDAN